MSSADLVREVKYKMRIDRDSDLAERLGVNRQNVSKWLNSNSKPDAETVLKMCVISDIKPEKALAILQEGYATLSLLLVTATFMLLILLNNFYLTDAFIHYTKRNKKEKDQNNDNWRGLFSLANSR